MDDTVSLIKIGGSLLDWPELPARIAAFLTGHQVRRSSQRVVLIAGGGPAADLVRRLDRDHHLSDETAHRLAIQAMDFTARMLATILPGSTTVTRLASLPRAWRAGRIPILIPSPILREIETTGADALPPSWEITSDSIAAWIAVHLQAESLILLKSAALPVGADRQHAARLERVDPHFPLVSQALARVEYLNLRDPAAEPITLT